MFYHNFLRERCQTRSSVNKSKFVWQCIQTIKAGRTAQQRNNNRVFQGWLPKNTKLK